MGGRVFHKNKRSEVEMRLRLLLFLFPAILVGLLGALLLDVGRMRD